MDFAKWVRYLDENDIDLYGYFGPVARAGYDHLCRSFPKEKRSQALLILGTFGGDPDAGYRIARALMHHYPDRFRVIVPYYCKSAGTLICIGAHELLMADKSELGPLDVQLRKQDEMFQQNSGLDIVRGIQFLHQNAIGQFRDHLVEINVGSGVSTKTASEIASRLVIGLYEPVFAQVDPIKLGETGAALQIAASYGERLSRKSKNLKADALVRLIHHYPSHSFVIDRAEAKELFEKVEAPDDDMLDFAKETQKKFWGNGSSLHVLYLNKLYSTAAQELEAAQPAEEMQNEPVIDAPHGGQHEEDVDAQRQGDAGPEGRPQGGQGQQPPRRNQRRNQGANQAAN